jgi:His-Xaa-Ser system protein HxsD
MKVDRRIYSDNVISKAVYWLSKDYTIVRNQLNDDFESVSAISKDGKIFDEISWNARLADALNDFKLREVVANETRDIKTILYAKAFADDEDFSDEDITD